MHTFNKNSLNQFRNIARRVLPWLILAVLLAYTYAKFFEHTYYGFRWNSENGEIVAIYVPQDGVEQPLSVGDTIIQIGPLTLEEFHKDLTQPMFNNIQRGEDILLRVKTDSGDKDVVWIFPGPKSGEVLDLFFSEGWLAYAFWLAGTLALFNLRPKDERRYLMIAFNYLTAIWLTMGSGLSQYHIWGSPIILRMSIWLCVPVYLHFHWVFPKPLTKLPPLLVWAGYILAALLSLGELLRLLDNSLYSLGFLIALAVSLILLIAHAAFQPESRRDLRLLLVASLLAFVPAIAIGYVGAFDQVPAFAGGWLLGLPLIPLAYLYAAYRRQLGGSEVRVNRFITTYIFVMLLFAVLSVAISLTVARFSSQGDPIQVAVLVAISFSVLASILTISGFSKFQTFVERRLLGIPFPQDGLLGVYSTQIAVSASTSSLLKFLENDILPTLLVRQFAFLRLREGVWDTLTAVGVTEHQIPQYDDLSELVSKADGHLYPRETDALQDYSWIRLALPLKIGDELIGVWFFGRRDPDDIYSQAELPLLRSLANQTSVALSNIIQADRIKTMYEANINRYEQERLRLAHDLHDSLLNEMAAMLMKHDPSSLPADFQESFDGLIVKLREIVSDLRPPMLIYGLKFAIEGLADNFSERNQDVVNITLDIQGDGEQRYPELVERNLYRIVQEACENASKYSQAKAINIVGNLSSEMIELTVNDDGIGFGTEISLKLDDMLANKHFGLAGMHERAALIGAMIKVTSMPEQGTQVWVTWESNGSSEI